MDVAAAPASATTILRLSADNVAYYYDRFSIKADGNVRVDFGNKTVVTGQSLVMDLRANRLLVAGGVRLTAHGASHEGAAFSEFFDDDRTYFMALTPAPERWTYSGNGFDNPEIGGEQPADAFALPDFATFTPIILAKRVTVGTRSFMRFGACRVAPIGGTRLYVPFPGLYINFSNDPNLAQTTLAAANAGAKVKFTGNTNATSAIALNYASTTKFGVGFEQNVIWQKGWGDFSVFPFNQTSKFVSAVVADAPSQTFGGQASTLSNAYPSGSSLPMSSAHFNYVQLTQSLHAAYLQLNYRFGNSYLLAAPPFPSAYGSPIRFGPSHPASVQLGLNSSSFHVVPGLEADVRGGYGYNYNGDGLQQFGGVTYATIWSPYAAVALFTPRLAFSSRDMNSAYLVVEASEQRQWNSLPHHVDQVTTGATLTQPVRAGSVSLAYDIDNVKDVYGNAQRQAYPVIVPPGDPGYAAFEGFATFRTLTLGAAYSINPFFALSVSGSNHHDFPSPSPAVFTPVQKTVLGVNPVANYLGQPPYDLPVAARIRVNRSLSINAQVTYYFNYFGNTWNNVQVQFLP